MAAHTPARFVFVVGKGGVGKSTTASALAVALADRGNETHLLSTDPAHSIGDIFGTNLEDGQRASPCTPLLTLEEFDAGRHAEAWLAGSRASIGELIERGTYLDREDVSALLECSLPGMDEVMAALRIADLGEGSSPARVVVDTAPTGHTLRLLDCADVIRSWATALQAMAAKAGAVAHGLTGRRIRFAGETVIEGLEARVSLFSEDVVGRADFVVVTRAGAVVAAETERLVADLLRRSLRVSAIVVVEEGSGDAAPAAMAPIVRVPQRANLLECEGLRAWGAGEADAAMWPMDPPLREKGSLADLLPPRPLMLFAGKGGVGKTTCAAAYAVALAAGRRIHLLSTDPAGSLADVFACRVDQHGTAITPGLTARQVDAESEFARFREMHVARIRAVFEDLGLSHSAPLDRAVLESLVEMAPPGLDEIFAVEAILDELGEHDMLVLDTAPTGHFLRLLEMPGVALAWTHSLLRVLLKYRSVVGLDGLAQDLLVWARRLKHLLVLLNDQEHTGVVIVTLSEALPMRETERLVARLRDRRYALAAIIRNRWTPDDTSRGSAFGSESTVLAHLTSPPPVGPEALLAFAGRWASA